jgi:hypoxanthine phosphoribosyltransferase
MRGQPERILIPAAEIERRIRSMGEEIRAEYPGRTILLIGVLKGSAIFLADLARAITGPVRFDFIGASSYGSRTASSGEVRLTKDVDMPVAGADIVVVEDIVDTGITLDCILGQLGRRGPRSMKVAALMDKPARHQRDVRIDYLGFTIPNEFVVGYGLDYAEDYRALPDVWVLGE